MVLTVLQLVVMQLIVLIQTLMLRGVGEQMGAQPVRTQMEQLQAPFKQIKLLDSVSCRMPAQAHQ